MYNYIQLINEHHMYIYIYMYMYTHILRLPRAALARDDDGLARATLEDRLVRLAGWWPGGRVARWARREASRSGRHVSRRARGTSATCLRAHAHRFGKSSASARVRAHIHAYTQHNTHTHTCLPTHLFFPREAHGRGPLLSRGAHCIVRAS